MIAEWIRQERMRRETTEVDLAAIQDAGFIELIGDASNTLASYEKRECL